MNILKKWGLRTLSIKGITYLAILMVAEIILGRLVIGNSSVQFTFSFIIIAIIAKWYGPFWSVGIAIIVDFIGTMLSGQPYFIGFTLSAVLVVIIYSLAFYGKDKVSIWNVLVTTLIITIFINILLNSLWVSILAHTSFYYFLPVRIIKNLISFPIQTILLYWILNNKTIRHMKPKIFN
ncbi:ECF transporter S component [Fructilactobacillus lindneri]|nr:folate family ECF transporter S component [Fructilactobacillus lindneri]ANZ57632.1 hypothetical protein AYR60_02040 [Fructilactobacillus lindneri]ANZ58902.1 hypothetical protein AYR59_02040 [Fructilactobacillus lindneri]POG97621.1 ECF transporter S component [Fructilactobacillus lindneri]POH03416.1 ECF transporter S component [Fructilactobacillus lindneri]POH04584.1 ECF transporter S component [Fructilactobacillus lindneri]